MLRNPELRGGAEAGGSLGTAIQLLGELQANRDNVPKIKVNGF